MSLNSVKTSRGLTNRNLGLYAKMAQDRRSLEKRRRCEASAAALVDCLDMLIEILMRLPANRFSEQRQCQKNGTP